MEGDGAPLRLELTLEGLGAAAFRQATRAMGTDEHSAGYFLLGIGVGAWMKDRAQDRAQRQRKGGD